MSIYDTGVNNIIKEYEEILNKIFELKNKIKSAFISLNKENLEMNIKEDVRFSNKNILIGQKRFWC